MSKFTSLILAAIALVAMCSATTETTLTNAKAAIESDLTNFKQTKTNFENSIAAKRTAVQTAQSDHVSAQDNYLSKQAIYWAKFDYHSNSEANVTTRTSIKDTAFAALQAAQQQRDGCPSGSSPVEGQCTTCLDADYYCTSVNDLEWNVKCDCNGLRAYRRAVLNDELTHTRNVISDLQEGNNPIDEYEQQDTALQSMLALEAQIVAELASIDAQEQTHIAFVAALQADYDLKQNEYLQAVDEKAYRSALMVEAENEMTAAKTDADSKGDALKSAVEALKAEQTSYENEQNTHFTTLKQYRELIREVTSALDNGEVSAKTAMYFEKGGYAEVPPVNLRKSFTIEFWAYFDPNTNNRLQLPVISQARIPGGDDTKFVFQIKLRGGPREKELEGKGHYDYYFWDARMGSPESPGYAVRLWGEHYTPRGWTHVAFVVDSTDDPATTTGLLYVDGELQYSKSFSGSRWSSPENTLLMKIKDSHGTRFGNGAIDELRFWSTARTVDEIRNNMNRIVDPRKEPLRSYYRFDDAEDVSDLHLRPNVLRDLTPNRLDGTAHAPAGLEGSAVQYIRSTAFEPHGANFINTDYAIFLDSTADHPNYVALPSQDLTGSFTIEAWFNVRGTQDDLTRLPKISQSVRDGTRREEFVFFLELVDAGAGNYKYVFKMGACANSEAVDCGYAVELESQTFTTLGWMHVAVSITNNEMANLFVNGECTVETCTSRLDAAGPATSTPRLSSSQPILIGKLVDDSGFHGMSAAVDEVRIHNRGRTQQQIQAFSSRTLPDNLVNADKSSRTLVAYYKFNEAQGVADVYDAVARDANDSADVAATGNLVGPRVRLAVGAF